jgi:hypothetical protein
MGSAISRSPHDREARVGREDRMAIDSLVVDADAHVEEAEEVWQHGKILFENTRRFCKL